MSEIVKIKRAASGSVWMVVDEEDGRWEYVLSYWPPVPEKSSALKIGPEQCMFLLSYTPQGRPYTEAIMGGGA